MSHNVDYSVYPENCNKKKVADDWDIVVRHNDWQEGASGLPSKIRWLENVTPLESRDEAEAFIQAHDRGWYDCLAVRFLDFTQVKPSSKIESLEQKVHASRNAFYEKDRTFHFANVQSTFIGCKSCGSKIARKYLKANFCPVCHNDLRPETTLKALETAKLKIKKAEEELLQEQKKFNEKSKKAARVMWLLKTEYHT